MNATLKTSLLYEDNNLLVGYYPGDQDSNSIAITFSSFSLPSAKTNPESWSKFRYGFQEKYLISINQKSIFFVSKSNDWYHNSSMESAFISLYGNGYLEAGMTIFLHGASMGGYGALKALSYTHATSVFLGSPQLCVNRNNGVVAGETRWPSIIDKLNHEHALCLDNLRSSKARIYVAFDPMHVLDYNQIRVIPYQCDLKLIPVSDAGHSAFIKLKSIGLLDDLMVGFLHNKDIQEIYMTQIRSRVETIYLNDVVDAVKNNTHVADILRSLSLCFTGNKFKKVFLEAALFHRPHGKLIQKMINDIEE